MNRRTGPMHLTEMAVTIVGTDTDTGKVMCSDSVGNEFEIDGTIRRKATGFPVVGERWLLERKGGGWVLDAQIGAPRITVVEGSRDGLHPVAEQMLEALARQGLIFDGTIGGIVPQVLDDTTDPAAPPEGEYDPDEPVDDPGNPPGDENGPGGRDPDTDDPTQAWVPLYLGSYNVAKDLGPRRAYNDLLRLTKSRVQVFGTQEMHAAERDSVCDRLGNRGWNYYRPKTDANSDENTIFWREDDFKKLDQGSIQLTAGGAAGSHMPARFLNWVKLKHLDSGRSMFFMATHWDPHIEGHVNGHGGPLYQPGRPSIDPVQADRVAEAFIQCQKTSYWMQKFGQSAPVFTVGDFNINWFSDARVRHPKFPYAKFRTVGTRANWDLIDQHPSYGTHGRRYIDTLWITRPVHWQVRPIQQWILTGYYSDHRPLLVKTTIRSKN